MLLPMIQNNYMSFYLVSFTCELSFHLLFGVCAEVFSLPTWSVYLFNSPLIIILLYPDFHWYFQLLKFWQDNMFQEMLKQKYGYSCCYLSRCAFIAHLKMTLSGQVEILTNSFTKACLLAAKVLFDRRMCSQPYPKQEIAPLMKEPVRQYSFHFTAWTCHREAKDSVQNTVN